MAIFPVSLEQHMSANYNSSVNSNKTQFGLGVRDRLTYKDDYVLNVDLIVDKVGLNTFETFYYEDLEGGTNDFTADNVKLGSMYVEGYRIVSEISVSAYFNDLFKIKFRIRPINENNRYNNVKHDCPLVPNYNVIPSDGLLPC